MNLASAYAVNNHQDAVRFRSSVHSYNPKSRMSRELRRALGFESCHHLQEPLRILDAMCGPGKVGQLITSEALLHEVPTNLFFNDARAAALELATPDSEKRIPGNVCSVRDLYAGFFDLSVVRFGLKDIPDLAKLQAVESLHASLVPGGRLVVADLYAPASIRSDVNTIHRTKQRFSGRNESIEGELFIPTRGQWTQLLLRAGFARVSTEYFGRTVVKISDWIDQFGTDPVVALSKVRLIEQMIIAMSALDKKFNSVMRIKTSEPLNPDDGILSFESPIVILVAHKSPGVI
ncbi:MAG: hypothetical protein AABW86_04435 [Candidatus Micrarchaeota archaeon]